MNPKVRQTGKARRKKPRTCVGCRKEEPKRELVRIVRTPGGEVMLDRSGKAPGRGAYLCRNMECLRMARKRDALSRALKTKVPGEIYDEIEGLCSGNKAAEMDRKSEESDL